MLKCHYQSIRSGRFECGLSNALGDSEKPAESLLAPDRWGGSREAAKRSNGILESLRTGAPSQFPEYPALQGRCALSWAFLGTQVMWPVGS